MNPRVKAVIPQANFVLQLQFENGEFRIFDVKPYLEKGFFQELKDPAYFRSVQPVLGTIQWPRGQDFCPDTLYELSEPLSESLAFASV